MIISDNVPLNVTLQNIHTKSNNISLI